MFIVSDFKLGATYTQSEGIVIAYKLALLVIYFLLPRPLDSTNAKSFLIIWDVGQGSMATIVTPKSCHHFDAGGDHLPIKKIISYCDNRMNRLFLSHWDWDHIRFARTLSYQLPRFCIEGFPKGQPSDTKKNFLRNISVCQTKSQVTLHYDGGPIAKAKTSNDYSRVFSFKGVLFPGDSSKSAEVQWIHKLRKTNFTVLLLGHHGSQTSTSESLIGALTSLRLGISSSDVIRYGHPHAEVRNRLSRHGVPIYTTSEWGTLIMEL